MPAEIQHRQGIGLRSGAVIHDASQHSAFEHTVGADRGTRLIHRVRAQRRTEAADKKVAITLDVYAHALPAMQQDAAWRFAAMLHRVWLTDG